MTFVRGCLVGAIVLICSSSVLAAEVKCKANTADYKKITDALKGNENLGKISEVFCPRISGNYARADFANNVDGGTAYLKKSNGNWMLKTYGTGIEPDDLIGAGFPKDVVKKLMK